MLSSKYLIIANGSFLSESIIREIAYGACVIALDGAANKLVQSKIKPDIILGDFDSISEDIVSYWKHRDVFIIPATNQNFTDFQKALFFSMHNAEQHGFLTANVIHVVCATGGRMDHELANIYALKKNYSDKCPVYIHNEYQTLQFVSNQTIYIQGKHHDYCGLFGMPEAMMTVKNAGLEYGGEEPYHLSSIQFSSSNRLIGDKGAIVDIQGDALIVHPPMLLSQRSC